MKAQVNKYNSVSRKKPFYASLWFYFAVILTVTLVVFSVWFFIIRPKHNSNASLGVTDSTTDNARQDDKTNSEIANKAIADQEKAAKAQTPAQYEGSDPNNSDQLTGYISYAAANGDRLTIRLVINQYLNSTGTCQLTMTSGEHQVTNTVETWAEVSTSTCQGFDIPLAELSASSQWQIKIKVDADGKTGIITGDVSL